MLKKSLIAVLLLISLKLSYCQETSTINPDYWTINIFVGQIQGYEFETPVISTNQTDNLRYPENKQPVIFPVHDKTDSTKFISMNQYLYDYGTPDGNGDYEIEYFPFLEKAINYFWGEMFKEIKTSTLISLFPTKIKFNYVYAPDGNPWIVDRLTTPFPDVYYQDAYLHEFRDMLQITLGDSIWNSYNSRLLNKRQLTILCLPSINSDFAWSFTEYVGTVVYLMYRPNHPDETNRIVAHELGHLITYFRDNGTPGAKGFQYNDLVQTQEGMQYTGQTFGTTGCYDMMHSSGGGGGNPPNMPYGIMPYFTEDIISTTLAYTSTNVLIPPTNFQHLVIEDSLDNNETHVRLKAVRERLLPADYGSVFQAVSLPIAIDEKYSSEIGVNAAFVENQKILIELRNGKGFDNFSPMYSSEENKGVLISHIIKFPNPSILTTLGIRIADIECATAYPDTNEFGAPYRNPDSTWTKSDDLSKNGIWYLGKKINDWLDEHAPNDVYPYNAGKGTWYRHNESANNLSLPSDFFNDTDHNMFTPTTRPNTNSWKNAETNIGVFIDKIEGDYADLRIYRNYHSVPLTDTTAKTLPDGTKGLTIEADGYIGENFYVGENMHLYLGGRTTTAKTTLVPGTDMHVRNGGYLQLLDESKLRLENSKLEFRKGSKFAPFAVAGIEIENSEMIFQDGYIQQDYNLVSYIISESGASSFFNTSFNMIGSSLLTLNENSKFTILSGSNVTLSSQSVLTLKSGSHLNIEAGSDVYLSTGTKLVIEGNAEITGNLVIGDGAIIEIMDNAKLLVNNSNINIHPATSVTLGVSSVLEVGANSSLNLDGGLPVMLGDDASIIIKDDGSLITTNLGTENVTFRNSGEMWYAIMCEVGSKIEFYRAEIIGAKIGIWGTPEFCRIENSSFLDCENGISIVNCPDYVITNNRMTGKGLNSYGYAKGSGITLTNCSLPISGNTIQNYADGIKLVSSSIILAENKLINNYNSGLLITGNGSKPVLVNSLSKDLIPRLNNEIYGNNINYPIYNGAQIYMRYSAGAYMTGGYNNIYSGQTGVVPSVPCIRGVWITTPVPVISKVIISAERNYWGYGSIDEINQPDFFYFRNSTFDTGYSIDFDPYALVPYTEDGTASTDLSTNEPRSTEATMLLNAMKLEDTGSSKASIKLYENIIKKYPNTPEYYVAESRLPGLYIEEELPLETILSSFDEAIENETALGKKFFKGLRVSTHIKAKNYDTAIMYAEEMKNEAVTEEEAMLSEIDIAVANLMKEAEGSGKSGSSTDSLEKLLNMLNGNDNKDGNPSDLAEASIPTQHELFQNYPNPFNPVTQIKFALAKTTDVRLSVYNISGQKIAELANGTINAGYHTVDFDGSRFNSGVYYYMLEVDGKNITKKMVLTK
ncbi:TPA: hypothetical protein DCR49_04180 [Candidatus Delongbacteria bacterium]|nr:hypothetical protein [Candidatus Delongbacteria bacterium]